MASCHIPKEQNLEPIDIPPTVSQRLDSLNQIMWHYYTENPDSAEVILYKTLDYLDSLDIPQMKFYVYMHLGQLYQYRKPDFFKAISKLGKAMEIFVDYPSSYNSNSYVYVDIGNMFFYYRFYDQAIDFYKIANRFAHQDNDLWGQTLAKQNIALSFQQLHMIDSACIYLQRAEELAGNNPDLELILAQNYSYLADLSLARKDSLQFVDIEKYYQASIDLYENHIDKNTDSENEISDITWLEIMSGNHWAISSYYFRAENKNKAKYHLDNALTFAEKAGSLRLKVNVSLMEIMQMENQLTENELVEKVNWVDQLVKNGNNLYLKKNFADSMIVLFAKRKLSDQQAWYLAYSNQLSDSIASQKLSDEFTSNIMLMSRISAEYSLQRLQLLELIKTQTIKNQTRVIAGITVFSIGTIISLLLFLIQKSRINRANRAMFEKIKQDLRAPQEVSIPESNTTRTDIYEKFDKSLLAMIEKEKSFLKKDLTLHDLAAMLNTNQTYLSNYLNKIQNTNFNDFVNQYRVKEACRLMLDHQNDNFTVENLAHLSGFNSTSTFYTAFKKFTGMSPSAFKNNR